VRFFTPAWVALLVGQLWMEPAAVGARCGWRVVAEAKQAGLLALSLDAFHLGYHLPD